MARFGSLDTQYFDDAGDPLISGKIYFYETGTTTPKTTYADINYTIPNANPVILTAAGRQPNIFFDGVAKSILTKSDDTQILVRDPVGDTASTFGNAWIASKDYNANDVVQGSDGNFYVSLVNGNVNNNPVSTTGYWTFLYSVEWNAGTTYKLGSVVTYDTIVYQSLQNANLNKNPSTETAWWVPIELVWSSTSTYAINANVVGTDGILYTSLQNANTNHPPASSPSWWVGTSAAAAASASAAATSASNAATSATNAANSATTANTQASNAASSASSASTSASNASTSATNAANSATSASGSASSASSSASSASSSASSAATSASNASTSATNAASSASSASSSASTATTQASNAAASASAASTSASNASTSATNAANSASSASTSATNASNSAGAASTSATNAANSATASAASANAAAASYDSFDDRYLGSKTSDPTVDNDGNPLLTGALYWNSVSDLMKVYTGSAWIAAYLPSTGYLPFSGGTMTGDITFAATQPLPANLVTGTLGVSNGGTGATTLTGVLKGNGTSAFTAGSVSLSSEVSGTLPVGSGGTGATTLAANNVILGNGTSAVQVVAPGTNGNVLTSNGTTWASTAPAITLAGNNAFTGANTFYNATGQTFGTATSTQDGLILTGRAGGSSSYRVSLTPATLSSSTTLTLPNVTDTVATIGTAQTFTAAQTFRAANSVRAEAASTQDAIVLAGRAGGTSSYAITLTPATLAASRTLTLPEPASNETLGYLNIPQNSQSAAYTLVLADAGKQIFHPSADTTARTFTIPANGSVAFPVGTAVTFINQNGAGVVTIAITTDTMRLAGAGTTGSRTLAANGVATAIKVTSTEWIISGTGLT